MLALIALPFSFHAADTFDAFTAATAYAITPFSRRALMALLFARLLYAADCHWPFILPPLAPLRQLSAILLLSLISLRYAIFAMLFSAYCHIVFDTLAMPLRFSCHFAAVTPCRH